MASRTKRWVLLLVAAVAGALLVPIATPSPASAQTTICEDLGDGQTCRLTPPADPTDPYLFTVPDGMHALTATVIGGAGADGDLGAAGGAGGLVVATVPVTPGQVLELYVASSGTSYDSPGTGWATGGRGAEGGGPLSDSGSGGGASAIIDQASGDLLVVAGGGGGAGGTYNETQVGGLGGAGTAQPGSQGASIVFGETHGSGGAGGCGGCESGATGGDGEAIPLAEGGGGGGGGLAGGSGGAASGTVVAAGGGGGGGSSGFDASVTALATASSSGTEGGEILLDIDGAATVFACNGGDPDFYTVPDGVTQIFAVVVGGQGGFGSNGSTLGSAPAAVTAELTPHGATQLSVIAGCGGDSESNGGLGDGGAHGVAHDPTDSKDGGAGGGGSSVAETEPGFGLWLVAGGGGGVGGDGALDDAGGYGGSAGYGWGPAGAGDGLSAEGSTFDPDPPDGGCGGCATDGDGNATINGEPGHNSPGVTGGGAGGGGGGGMQGGKGGESEAVGPTIGAGGGGAGSSYYNPFFAQNASVGVSTNGGDGLVVLIAQRTGPTISVQGGSNQTTPITSAFAEPLEVLVTDAVGGPLAGETVTFTLGSNNGASGTFVGGGTSATAVTDADGIAISPVVSANAEAGTWTATASVADALRPATFTLQNTPSPTATVVIAEPDPATVTQTITFTARVVSTYAHPPSGYVQFAVDGTDVGDPVALNGVGIAATDAPSGLTVGSHTVTASYLGTADYLTSSGTSPFTIEKTPTATTVTSSANPSDVNEAVTFTATVSVPAGSTAYDGTVQFTVDGNALGSPVPVNGSGVAVSPPITPSAVGSLPVVATAAATDDFLGSDGTMTQVVDPDGTATSVTSSGNPLEYGTPLDVAATVTAGVNIGTTPTGAVTFFTDAETDPLCTGALTAAATSCTVATALTPGPHSIRGEYTPDTTDFTASTGVMTQLVTKARTVTTLTASPSSTTAFGEPVTFHASVARLVAGTGIPSGTVQFALDGVPVGDPVVLGPTGATSEAVTPPDADAHVVTAAYSGDTLFLASSAREPQIVVADGTEILLTATPEPSELGAPVTIQAVVTSGVGATAGDVAAAAGEVPTGAVQFRIDGADLGAPVPLNAGAAEAPPVSDLAVGPHTVTAVYLPADPNFLPSVTSIVHSVGGIPTTTTVTAAPQPSVVGEPVQITAIVAVTPGAEAGAAAAIVVGTVEFRIDGGVVGTPVTVVGGRATLPSLTDLAAGGHTVTATFTPADVNVLGSAGATTHLVLGSGRSRNPNFTG